MYFRDNVHGLLAWAVATLLAAALVSGAIDAGAAAGAAKEASDGGLNPVDYFSDMLLRTDKAPADVDGADVRSEVVRIFANGMQAGSLAAADRAYLARVVAARTGLPQADAEKRVDEVYTTATNAKKKAKAAADIARKATAGAAIWMTVAMLLGAFVASLAATFGGRLRDNVDTPLSARTR